ncbi:DUF4239 domain-containing protein [Polynucleobacter sp. es-EL-1]|uniref:bestrophin-like domain n=1 Tax=Polynucleobacter sp. es-EL-1 TaxID=1855652 RepID=UPI001BFE642D|nr:DUF4239 domain-containing protein [Polynucleobacter sp. es-EL-1]QWE10200.1 DUF4239 domain-containing protein [Polynucleobacter sp. es-EL-1]
MQNLAEQFEFLAIALLIAFFTFSAVLIAWFFVSPSKRKLAEPLEGVVAPFFSLPAVLFSLIAALLATSVWENYTIATKAIRSESQSIMTIISLANSIPSLKNNRLDEASKQYAKSIIDDEWDTLSSRQVHSPITHKYFEDLRSQVFSAVDSLQNTAESRALFNAFQTINTARETRLAFVSFDIHHIRWYAILFLALLVQISVALVHLSKPKALITALIIATATVLVPICMIALTLSSPYHGVIAISNAPYLEILK